MTPPAKPGALRCRVVLFGGFGAGGGLLGDTWEYDGRSWRKVSESGPSPRGAFGMAYDRRRGRTVLFGGAQDFGQPTFTDTWEWDGDRWALVSADGPASSGGLPGLTYDAKHGRLVLFGGGGDSWGALDGTWAWDGKRWVRAN